MIEHVSEIRVRYADTDQMKQVYYGKYFEYFEQGRTELLRSLGLPYGELEREGFLLPVLEARAVYKRPAQYDDLLRVRTRMVEFPGVRFQIDYSIDREIDHEVIAEGITIHTFVKAETRRPTRPPEVFLAAIRKGFEERNV